MSSLGREQTFVYYLGSTHKKAALKRLLKCRLSARRRHSWLLAELPLCRRTGHSQDSDEHLRCSRCRSGDSRWPHEREGLRTIPGLPWKQPLSQESSSLCRKHPQTAKARISQIRSECQKDLYECNLHGKSHPAIATNSETVRKSLPTLLFQVEG